MPNNDLISRETAVQMLREKAKGYTISLFASSEECYIAKVVATECAAEIKNLPAVDAEPVRRGRYGFVGMDMIAGTRAFYFGTCSECRERINFEANHKNYCPNCGAKMELPQLRREDG